MPLYEFNCKDCKNTFEEFVRIKVDNAGNDSSAYPECPVCGSKNTIKQIAPCTFLLKGKGWAKDNYS